LLEGEHRPHNRFSINFVNAQCVRCAPTGSSPKRRSLEEQIMIERSIHVEIVTPVHNRRETTLQCLRSLSRIDRTGLKVHIIIVDDGSTDGTSEAVRQQFPEVEIIQGDGNLWYTAGTNRGIEAALLKRPDYILAINDDSIFEAQFLQHMIRCARENPRSIVGALLLLWDRPHKVFQVCGRWQTWYGGWRTPQGLTVWTVPDEPWEVNIIVGNCVLYPVAAIEQAGLMKEKAFPYGFGDSEYTPRMRRAGWRLLIEPRARVWCEPNRIAPPLRSLPVRQLLKTLFLDRSSQHNLVRMFVTRCHAAPSRLQGVAAFGVTLVRMLLKGVGLGGSWPNWPDEIRADGNLRRAWERKP
jgi:GT2 family glycosyltransferase